MIMVESQLVSNHAKYIISFSNFRPTYLVTVTFDVAKFIEGYRQGKLQRHSTAFCKDVHLHSVNNIALEQAKLHLMLHAVSWFLG